MGMGSLMVRRIYDDPHSKGGEYRVLVDRLWPRGLKRSTVDINEWLREIAPSTELRRWYGHDPERFGEFAQRYREELSGNSSQQLLDHLRSQYSNADLVLLTATRVLALSHATVLGAMIEAKPPTINDR